MPEKLALQAVRRCDDELRNAPWCREAFQRGRLGAADAGFAGAVQQTQGVREETLNMLYEGMNLPGGARAWNGVGASATQEPDGQQGTLDTMACVGSTGANGKGA